MRAWISVSLSHGWCRTPPSIGESDDGTTLLAPAGSGARAPAADRQRTAGPLAPTLAPFAAPLRAAAAPSRQLACARLPVAQPGLGPRDRRAVPGDAGQLRPAARYRRPATRLRPRPGD